MTIGAYDIDQWEGLFDKLLYRSYYKDGRLIASSVKDVLRYYPTYDDGECELTRAQGLRYWQRYFPGRYCYQLPKALQEAIEREALSHGYYVDKVTGEIIGYEG